MRRSSTSDTILAILYILDYHDLQKLWAMQTTQMLPLDHVYLVVLRDGKTSNRVWICFVLSVRGRVLVSHFSGSTLHALFSFSTFRLCDMSNLWGVYCDKFAPRRASFHGHAFPARRGPKQTRAK